MPKTKSTTFLFYVDWGEENNDPIVFSTWIYVVSVAIGIVPGDWNVQLSGIHIVMRHPCFALLRVKIGQSECLADINTGFAGCLKFHLLYISWGAYSICAHSLWIISPNLLLISSNREGSCQQLSGLLKSPITDMIRSLCLNYFPLFVFKEKKVKHFLWF